MHAASLVGVRGTSKSNRYGAPLIWTFIAAVVGEASSVATTSIVNRSNFEIQKKKILGREEITNWLTLERAISSYLGH